MYGAALPWEEENQLHIRLEGLAPEAWAAELDEVWPLAREQDPYGYNLEARANFLETHGDRRKEADRAVALTAYRQAYEFYGENASAATSGGEGYARMQDVHRVQEKITALEG